MPPLPEEWSSIIFDKTIFLKMTSSAVLGDVPKVLESSPKVSESSPKVPESSPKVCFLCGTKVMFMILSPA